MALTKITSSLVAINAIQGTLIADNAITAVHIAQNAITQTQIAAGALSDAIAANSITAAMIPNATAPTFGNITSTGDISLAGGNLTSTAGGFYIDNSYNGENIYIRTTTSNSFVTPVKIHSGGVFEAKLGAVFNEDSADVDFRVESNGNANRFFIDGGSNSGEGAVIIGHNASLGQHRVFQIVGNSPDTAGMEMFKFTDDSSGPTLSFTNSRGGSLGANTTVNDGDTIGGINWFANDGTDAGNYVANITAKIDGTPGSNDTPGALVFTTTADGANSGTERMRIDAAGNVGIGTATPGYPLHVAGSTIGLFNTTPGDAILYLGEGEGSGAYAKIYWKSSDDTLRLGTQTGGDTIIVQEASKVGVGPGAGNVQSNLSVTGDNDAITMNIGTSLAAVGDWQGMAFGDHGAMKAGIFYERQTNYARGRLIFAIDDTADTSDATLADAAMYINRDKSVSVVGALTVSGLLTVNGSNGFSVGSVGGDHRIDTAGSGSNVFRFLNSSDQITGIEITALKASSGVFSGSITSADKTVSASEPAATSNPSAIGHFWINTTSGEAYVCTDASNNANKWTNVGDGSGGKPFAGFDLMMIGGGGGGGGELQGGGGAGGLLYFTGFTGSIAYGTQYTITIGAGGAANAGNDGSNGGDTTAFSETAGGGEGGGVDSGGGGDSGTSAIVTSNYITASGWSYSGGNNAGNPGAGGAGSAGNGETRPGGNTAGGYGGAGQYISNIYNGSDTYAWAGGGGGPGYGNTEDGGAGGVGGGGGGGVFSEGSPSGTPGTGGAGLNNGDAGTNTNSADNGGDAGANTGGGGGGGSHRGGGQSSSTGGPGGSGIVCIKQIQTEKAATTTGTVVKTTADGYRYYAFTGSGSITFNA